MAAKSVPAQEIYLVRKFRDLLLVVQRCFGYLIFRTLKTILAFVQFWKYIISSFNHHLFKLL